ncbi:hypothetical protein HMPREF9086_1876 [Enterobacter hormaechei ATCC 49162]|nr:hypothetical protein HMPREF9086_1876 [Enterobacter hormaechei ATCC 49162]
MTPGIVNAGYQVIVLFCSHPLAEFHRKLCLLDAQSFSLSMHR